MKLTDAEQASLVEKCQENGWLRIGGYDWQDDPFLEEYPYDFAVVEDVEELREKFVGGNWAIRQGFVYDDLAFIQQVNGGDEWWTLKRVGDSGTRADWVDFESWSFEPSADPSYRGAEPKEFVNNIRSMQMATPEQCRALEYALPKDSPRWDFETARDIDFGHAERTCRSFEAEMGGYRLRAYERPSFEGFATELIDGKTGSILLHGEGAKSALDAAKSLIGGAKECIANDVHDPNRLRDLRPLGDRAGQAREAARAASAPDRAVTMEAKEK